MHCTSIPREIVVCFFHGYWESLNFLERRDYGMLLIGLVTSLRPKDLLALRSSDARKLGDCWLIKTRHEKRKEDGAFHTIGDDSSASFAYSNIT